MSRFRVRISHHCITMFLGFTSCHVLFHSGSSCVNTGLTVPSACGPARGAIRRFRSRSSLFFAFASCFFQAPAEMLSSSRLSTEGARDNFFLNSTCFCFAAPSASAWPFIAILARPPRFIPPDGRATSARGTRASGDAARSGGEGAREAVTPRPSPRDGFTICVLYYSCLRSRSFGAIRRVITPETPEKVLGKSKKS